MVTMLTEMEIGEGETTLDLILVGVTGAGGLTLGLMQGGVEVVAMTTLDMDMETILTMEIVEVDLIVEAAAMAVIMAMEVTIMEIMAIIMVIVATTMEIMAITMEIVAITMEIVASTMVIVTITIEIVASTVVTMDSKEIDRRSSSNNKNNGWFSG